MPRAFPKLGQTHVRIEIEKGRFFNCPMLDMGHFEEYRAIEADLLETDALQERAAGAAASPEQAAGMLAEYARRIGALQQRMAALARQVMPEKYAGGLCRLDVAQLGVLLGYLMYGDGDDAPVPDAEDEAKKK